MRAQEYGKWKKLLVYTVVALGIYVGIRCLFWAVFPFFVSFLCMKVCYPPAAFLQKKIRIGKGISVCVLFLILAASVGCLLWLGANRVTGQLWEIWQNVDKYQWYGKQLLEDCCCRLEGMIGIDAGSVRSYVTDHMSQVAIVVKERAGTVVMEYSYSYAKGFVKVIGILVVIVAVTVFLVKDYDKLKEQLRANPFYENIVRIKERVFYAVFVYVRAQLVIIMVISAICCVALYFMGMNRALTLGVVIGVLDALPFIGTGTVLIPWMMIQLLRGEILSAALLGSLYLVCSFTRELLEPKLIGTKLGVLPVYVVASVYVGIVLYGVGGVLLGPLHALLTLEIGKQWMEEHGSGIL